MNNADKPAYPTMKVDRIEGEVANWQEDGLTKREAFAIAAMQGCLAYSYSDGQKGNFHNNSTPSGVAKASVEYADALLEELERTEE